MMIGAIQKLRSYKMAEFYCPSHFFFSVWVFFQEHSRFTGHQGKGEDIYLTPLYHFHPLHRPLDINRVIAADSSPLPIASSWTRAGQLEPGTLGFRAQVANH